MQCDNSRHCFEECLALQFYWLQSRLPGKRFSIEELPRSDCPVGISVEDPLDCLLMWEGSTHCGGRHSLVRCPELCEEAEYRTACQSAKQLSSQFLLYFLGCGVSSLAELEVMFVWNSQQAYLLVPALLVLSDGLWPGIINLTSFLPGLLFVGMF